MPQRCGTIESRKPLEIVVKNLGYFVMGMAGVAAVAIVYFWALPNCTHRKAIKIVQKDVTSMMKSPSTVTFPERPTVESPSKFEIFIDVSGPVDSQNSFGAIVRNRYSARLIASECRISGTPIIQ